MTSKSAFLLALMFVTATGTQAAGIETSQLSETVKVLASEEFEGRKPGEPGEEKTVAYLIQRFAALGLEPGGENGAWTQAVPLVKTQLLEPVSLELNVGDASQALVQTRDIEASTVRPLEQIRIDRAPVVFVGFGANAPERQWDDFGDMDLEGKVAVFLVNDPDFAAGPGEEVAGRFGNRRMTYYGRWTYKFEEAGRRGAIAAFVIHEDKAAGYGWSVASASPGENYSIVRAEGEAEPVTLQGWLHGDAAARLFKNAGLDLDEQRVLARKPDFRAFEMQGVTFSADLAVKVEHIESQNVLALLPGASRPDETLMVSAHWDAYGQGEADAEGRTVRPGANDDALGTAGVIDLARVLKQGPPLERSVVFAVWTAEESGLLGSAAYASDPVYPLEKTVANLTLDILQTAGPARDVILVGEGQSELEDDLERAAAEQGRVVTPENLPENGLFFRADHFSLARRGVPVLLIMGIAGGSDLVDGGRAAGDQWIADYIANCYHQTCDEWDPAWDLRGAAQDIELFHTIINELGNSSRWPQWKTGSEFKAIRDESAGMRLPAAADPREDIISGIDERFEEHKAIALKIWELAELGYLEVESSALLQEKLAAEGFRVQTGLAGIPTSFLAEAGSGGPVIALLAEFDALPGITQTASPLREEIPGKAGGQACGHHLFGTASLGAAVAIKRWMEQSNVPGTIRVYGTPAEEGGSGKVYMVREGLFDDVDAVLSWHPGDVNRAQASPTLANRSARFNFSGISAHAAGAPEKARSALDGVESFNYMINLMREHVPQETRIHYVITAGGEAPNVVPDHAQVYYYVRHPDSQVLGAIWERVEAAARGAAQGTGTAVEWEIMHGNHSLLPNGVIVERMQSVLESLGGYTYSAEEQKFAERIYPTLNTPEFELGSEQMVAEIKTGLDMGSTDVGDISWNIPTGEFTTATWVPGTAAHSWQAIAAGGTTIGIKGLQLAAKILALTAVDFFQDPELIEQARAELDQQRGEDFQYTPLLGDRAPALDYRLEQ